MAVGAVHVLEANAHDSRLPRQLTAALLGASLTSSFAGGLVASEGHGVASSTDYEVTENGSPNMSVNVSAGFAFVRGQFSTYNQGVYGVPNDGTVNLAITAADGTNPRWDLVILQVRDDDWGGGGGSNDARLVVVAGTPAASPADPSLASYTNNLVLARVVVPAGVSSIVESNITNLRTVANNFSNVNTRLDTLEASYETTAVTGSAKATFTGRLIRTPGAGGFDIVHGFSFSFANSTGGPLVNNDEIGTIPLGYRPANSRRFVAYNISTGNNNVNIIVNPSGSIIIQVGGGWIAPASGASFGANPLLWECTEAPPS